MITILASRWISSQNLLFPVQVNTVPKRRPNERKRGRKKSVIKKRRRGTARPTISCENEKSKKEGGNENVENEGDRKTSRPKKRCALKGSWGPFFISCTKPDKNNRWTARLHRCCHTFLFLFQHLRGEEEEDLVSFFLSLTFLGKGFRGRGGKKSFFLSYLYVEIEFYTESRLGRLIDFTTGGGCSSTLPLRSLYHWVRGKGIWRRLFTTLLDDNHRRRRRTDNNQPTTWKKKKKKKEPEEFTTVSSFCFRHPEWIMSRFLILICI